MRTVRTVAEITQERDAELAHRKEHAQGFRDNLVSLMIWPEAQNYRVYVYEFDAGFRTLRFGRKHTAEGARQDMQEYNLYHANTLVVLATAGKVPKLVVPFVLWTTGPFDAKDGKTPLYVPPYSNLSGNAQLCVGNLPPQVQSAKGALPEHAAEYQDTLLSHILFNSVWTDSIPDLAFRLVPGGLKNGTAHDRFKAWEKLGDKALEAFDWTGSKCCHKTWKDFCKNLEGNAKAYLGGR